MYIKLPFRYCVGCVNIIKKFFEAICFKETTSMNKVVDIANVNRAQKYAKGGNVSI